MGSKRGLDGQEGQEIQPLLADSVYREMEKQLWRNVNQAGLEMRNLPRSFVEGIAAESFSDAVWCAGSADAVVGIGWYAALAGVCLVWQQSEVGPDQSIACA